MRYTISMMPKAAIFDLDGTLTESKSAMTPEMGALLARLMGKMPVAIMSGGALVQFQKQLLPALPPSAQLERLYLFPTSAAQCYIFENGILSAKYNLAFTPEERTKILSVLDAALKATGMDVPPTPVWGERIEDRGAQVTFSALGQQAPYEEKKKWDPDRTKRAPLAEILKRELPDFHIAVNATTSIDITRKGINKAYGIERLSEMLALPITDMLYIGDALFPGGNDAIVIPTGVPTRDIASPQETAEVIEGLLR